VLRAGHAIKKSLSHQNALAECILADLILS
jgi:hypothetical protein